MIMKLIHLKPDNYIVSTWSGGTTTQIGIAPQGAVYADRNFMWRISSATVDLEVSDFTPLPDYDRLIATLEGEIDVTGAGDASNASIILGLTLGLTPAEAAVIACAVSSITIQQLGTTGTATPAQAMERVRAIGEMMK
jgi:hypothetical protein